jgi:hypothetical protein
LFASQDPEKYIFVVQQTEMITLMPLFHSFFVAHKKLLATFFALQGDAALKGPT